MKGHSPTPSEDVPTSVPPLQAAVQSARMNEPKLAFAGGGCSDESDVQ